MGVPPNHRAFSDAILAESITSVATSPVAVDLISPCAGLLHKVFGAAHGTFTGNITFAVTIAGAAADVAGGALVLAAGAGARSASVDIPKVGSGAVYVNEGDVITITPSGGTGASIPGAVTAIIREF